MNEVENPLIVKFREQLLRRGPAGIKQIGAYFRQVDDDNSKLLSLEEFQRGIQNHNIIINSNESLNLFKLFDRDNSNTINYDEFLLSVRPPLNKSRLTLIDKAFDKLDRTRDKKITIDDLKNVYNVKFHPKYLNGEWTEDQVLRVFLDEFDTSQHKDGTVTYDEFVLYYAGVSSSIDSDPYFDVMMRQCWKI